MTPCEAVAALSAISLAIAKGKSTEEINILSTYFSQIGDTLDTIAVSMECSESKDEKNECKEDAGVDTEDIIQ